MNKDHVYMSDVLVDFMHRLMLLFTKTLLAISHLTKIDELYK